MTRGPREAPRSVLRLLALVLAHVLVGLVVAALAWPVLFTHTSATTVLASHDAVVHPTLDGRVRLDMGPFVPDVRTRSGSLVGVRVEMGKTTADSATELAQRYAAIAASPEAEVRRIQGDVTHLALVSAARAALAGLVVVAVWLLVGRRRRGELWQRLRRPPADRRALVAVAVVVLLVVGLVTVAVRWPDEDRRERVQADTWIPVQDAVSEVPVPDDLAGWQIQGGLFTQGTRRLLLSLFDTYDRSKVFYAGVVDRVPEMADQLRTPEDGETVAVLVSDRHDNIGMDQVVRRVADAAGATAVLDAGDDTSTGATWEEFSLASLDSAFDGYDARVAVAGNHDNGTFVARHLADLGWTHLVGTPVEPFGGVRVTGVDDPRSSGLGTWRDETGLSFAEVKEAIAQDVCDLDDRGERVATLLVHDANLGATALARGCTDLVLAGHVHAQIGPNRVEGENGRVGYTYTNGTTGGAAYAIAIGSKLRRDAEFTFVTYRDGRPVGVQPVTVTTTGALTVADWIPLDLGQDLG